MGSLSHNSLDFFIILEERLRYHVRIPGIEASHLCRARLHVNIGQENTPGVVYKLPRLLAGYRKV
jgi:hypothetical protein